MELIAFRVSMYKGIIDSGWVDIDNLTVFVGKNESGKTSILKGLHKFNPYKPKPGEMSSEVDRPERYEIADEWPRGLWMEKREEHKVCQAKFRLSDEEKEGLLELTTGEKVPDTIEVSRNYANQLEVIFGEEIFLDKSDPAEIDTIFGDLPEVKNSFSNEFKKCAQNCINEVKRLANERQFAELEKLVQKHEPLLRRKRSYSDADSYADEGWFINRYLEDLGPLIQKLQQLPTPKSKVHEYIQERLPTFIYMDEYRTFSGNAHLKDVQSRKSEGRLTEEDKTFRMILSLSNLDLDKLVTSAEGGAKQIEQRQNDLAGGATALTKIFSKRLSDRQYQVEYRCDGQNFFTYISDDHDSSIIRLEERSKGFQWYFSFNLMFMHETTGTFKGCVILLDEPGLHLHPNAQKDLLETLEVYAQENILLYTTHLPFMIDLKHPDRIRILKETDDNGIVVTTDLVESSPDASFVLQAALGMDASQSALVADRNLVVEGVHDYWILMELSDLLQADRIGGLPEDVHVTPATGASKAVPIVTFMIGQNLDVVALFDSDNEGRTAKKTLDKAWIMEYKESYTAAILLGDAVGASGDFALEDLFPMEFYMESVQETYPNLNEITLQGEDVLWNRVKRALEDEGIKNPNKGSVAKRLRKRLSGMKGSGELPPETKEKAIKLFQTIRKALGEENTETS